jgi:hypothetical protein
LATPRFQPHFAENLNQRAYPDFEEDKMFLNSTENHSKVPNEILELNAEELEHVAGGPEVENDPGQP